MIDEACTKLNALLHGQVPEQIAIESLDSEEDRQLARLLNELFTCLKEVHEFILPLSQGNLAQVQPPRPRNFLGSPFKELHSRLLQLTWQTNQVAQGDYNQRIDFMGDFSNAFNCMVNALDQNEQQLKVKIAELEGALAHITQLEGILPICSHCKRVRLDGADPRKQESWVPIEAYLSKKTQAMFSHGICPECVTNFYLNP
ncbi:hypothetical protein JWJ90_21760 [Desulfobulbus rhabdoformis]|uniref:HAMP domain-containing protein n=1 Tax=Desulfobulbus rhabdoformis TaxID=34032 RepID=UPI0019666781|nr:hypothetical protein [Desulfobulbus rhabdoformis]MBM9616893.1 hypothetical protein [Desulfobulbus rhabdoformis]